MAQQIRLPYADLGIARTESGEVTVDYYLDSNATNPVYQENPDAHFGNNVVLTRPEPTVTFQQSQELIWHRVYFEGTGQFVQIRIYLSDEQLKDPLIVNSDFVLEAIILSLRPEGRLIG